MNLIEFVVTEVKSEPYFNHLWCVDVVAESYGRSSPTTVVVRSEEEAKKVDIGYKFDA